ncbi:unnamed protein product [Anisakis simplex]|uniref:Uncharacterized protein n=1 Tax=Anisakis simplex TaxID=6269 RepID=A0A3P6TAH7_ANISI|nr:unnamed protein product [Anisakis simplex]
MKEIPEVIIGKRLVSTLLSRYVLLEQCAHSILYPVLLRPSDMENSEKRNGLLSFDGFRKWVVPEVLRIFPVHDKSVRIALLNHFPLYINYFTQSQLTNVILPELRLGMCDSDDDLVSASLHSMAHLVPILGGSAVTGLPHKKSFADGTPKKEGLYCRENVLRSHVSSPLIVLTPTIDTKKDDNSYSLSPSNNLSRLLSEDDDYYDAHERNNIKLRLISTNDDEICASSLSTSELQSNEQMNDAVQSEWSTNWGSDGNEDENDTEYDSPASLSSPMSPLEPISASQHGDASNLQPYPHIVKQSTPTDMRNDTDEAEKSKDENCTVDDDIDYFADMEPIIKKTPSLNEYSTKQPHESIASNFTSRFSILPADDPSTTPDANANNYGAWETTIDDWDAD